MIKQLFFLALLPPKEVQQKATEIKQYFQEFFNSSAALKSPPHITLQPPFEWSLEDLPDLTQNLTEFAQAQSAISVSLDGFACFRPRVIYINVHKSDDLLTLKKKLTTHLELKLNLIDHRSKLREFTPHLTVAFKDLTPDNFYQAWVEFEHKKFFAQFIVPQLTLLIHQEKRWHIHQEFNFYV